MPNGDKKEQVFRDEPGFWERLTGLVGVTGTPVHPWRNPDRSPVQKDFSRPK